MSLLLFVNVVYANCFSLPLCLLFDKRFLFALDGGGREAPFVPLHPAGFLLSGREFQSLLSAINLLPVNIHS